MRIVVHPGPGKSGTTSLQKYFVSHSKILKNKYNIFYPILLGEYSHNWIILDYIDPSDWPRVYCQGKYKKNPAMHGSFLSILKKGIQAEQLPPTATIVIISEFISQLRGDSLRRFVGDLTLELASSQITFVPAIRTPGDSFLASLIQQKLKLSPTNLIVDILPYLVFVMDLLECVGSASCSPLQVSSSHGDFARLWIQGAIPELINHYESNKPGIMNTSLPLEFFYAINYASSMLNSWRAASPGLPATGLPSIVYSLAVDAFVNQEHHVSSGDFRLQPSLVSFYNESTLFYDQLSVGLCNGDFDVGYFDDARDDVALLSAAMRASATKESLHHVSWKRYHCYLQGSVNYQLVMSIAQSILEGILKSELAKEQSKVDPG